MIAVAVGGAAGWDAELAEVERNVSVDLYAACNDVGVVMPRLDLWCSLHPERLVQDGQNKADKRRRCWVTMRRDAGLPMDFLTVTHTHDVPCDRVVRHWTDGSSGMLAVAADLDAGADHVICCGIRLDNEPNAFRSEPEWHQAKRYRIGWQHREHILRGRVHSMSGWTREFLGAPDWDMLQSEMRTVDRAA